MTKKMSELLHGKNINFLIGSGAGVPLYPTLSLVDNISFEQIVTKIKDEDERSLLYAYFIKELIYPIISKEDEDKNEFDGVKEKYKTFLKLIISFLVNEGNDRPKRVNIFTTNYDLMFENAYNDIMKETHFSFLNDGGRGLITRYIDVNNYNLGVLYDGYNSRYRREIPSINLCKMHGSLSWLKEGSSGVVIDYSMKNHLDKIKNCGYFNNNEPSCMHNELKKFFEKFNEQTHDQNTNEPLTMLELNYNVFCKNHLEGDKNELSNIMEIVEDLPIVFPTKRKFHDTVFEQQYYQMLRLFSYELEKESTVLIVFGFSFYDEHILEIFKRTMLNPTLEVYVIQYDKITAARFKEIFKEFKNIHFYPKSTETFGNWEYLIKILEGSQEIDEVTKYG